ncbi:MAG TPA: 1,4-alpha-glucan branching protein GlgB [Dokdonella sp.]|nr:1,4-alpha-glucan branching protein GlgB [Dokdonella sp.]
MAAARSVAATAIPLLGELDCHLLAEGTHARAYEALGANARVHDGVSGVVFAVWAPNARRVSVVGSFNDWNADAHPLRRRSQCGVWETFVAGVPHGALYKFSIVTSDGGLALKADPYARWTETPPASASRVWSRAAYAWGDQAWMARRAVDARARAPLAIYEVHLGSWRRRADGQPHGYAELADLLVDYVLDAGFTHIEILPLAEHPFAGSWGYQPVSLYAPSSRWGTPDELRTLVDRCHRAGIGVLLDWVPAHFPDDAHGLARFDGTCLYEHEDPRIGRHREWRTLVYNYDRREVANFLIANALYWLREFHVDGLRVDAVAAMLYLDYDREAGEWLPNPFGGRENLAAVEFLRRLNASVHAQVEGALMIAEESTAWPAVSRPAHLGGLGFDYKWNMGWMNDTLRYMRRDPVHRRHHHDELTFGLLYAHSEHFVLPVSHDEVVYGKGSLLGKMPGDRWQRFANLRLYLALLYTQPGKKHVFMGCEFGQASEWCHDGALDWSLLADPAHAGVLALVRDLNRLYASIAALHAGDGGADGFRWIDCHDSSQSVLAYIRVQPDDGAFVVVVCNFTPVPRFDYRIGVPLAGTYREVLNSDACEYGGSGIGNLGSSASEPVPSHGYAHSLALALPPLAALVLLPP